MNLAQNCFWNEIIYCRFLNKNNNVMVNTFLCTKMDYSVYNCLELPTYVQYCSIYIVNTAPILVLHWKYYKHFNFGSLK